MRRILAVLAGAAVAVLAAFMLGEFTFDSVFGLLMGVLLGFFIAEAVAGAGGERGAFAIGVSVVLAAGSAALAVAISTERLSDRPDPVPGLAWVAVALAPATAALTARTRRKTADGSRYRP